MRLTRLIRLTDTCWAKGGQVCPDVVVLLAIPLLSKEGSLFSSPHTRCLRHGQRNAGAPSTCRRPGGASLPLAHGARYIHSKVRIPMSIRQSPQPTERAQAARSANAQQATGPATPEGK